MLAAAEQIPGKMSVVGRAAILDGRVVTSSSIPKRPRIHPASVAAASTETAPGKDSVALRAKLRKRVTKVEPAFPKENPGSWRGRDLSRESHADATTTARAGRGG